MSTAAPQLLPSAQRPVPLQMRHDLRVERIPYQETTSFVVKDPVSLKYFRFQPEQYRVLELLDGTRNLEQIRETFQREFPAANLSLEEIQSLISDLYKSGLVYSNRVGQGKTIVKQRREKLRKKVTSTLQNILYLRLPGWDPERTLRAIHPYFKWLYSPLGVAVWAIIVASSWILIGVQFQEFQNRLPEFRQFFGWPNLMYLWVVLGAAKIIHEFGHGLTCVHYRAECHEMGVMLLVFSPCLYCDVTDSWMLRNKWQRIMIAAAGMYIEVLLAAFAVFAWWSTQPGLFHHLCLNLFFVSTVTTVIFNANPLMRYDGYYMLADFLEIPNLRPKADKMLREAFSWICLGIESRPDPFMPQTGKAGFIAFAIAAALYRWVILFGIVLFFYTFLKPYGLQSIGIAMAVVSISSIIGSLGFNVYQIVSTPRRDPLSVSKITVSLTLLLGAVIGMLFIPFPWSLKASLVIEPYQVRHVYVVTPGRLEEIKVQPGAFVKKGDVLARLSNFEKEQDYRKLQTDAEVTKVDLTTQRARQDEARAGLAEEKLRSLEDQLADYREQLAKLVITAPCDGKVVGPARREPPKLEQQRLHLPRWWGTPFDAQNQHCFMQTREELCSIAPNEHFQAVLVVDQADRNDIRLGGPVRLKLDELPDRTYQGTVADLSHQQLEYVPPALSNKAQGDLPTVTDAEGREKLMSIAYQATVLLDEDSPLLRSGFRGRAKFLVGHRSAVDWIIRYLRQTFHFRL